MRLYLSGFWEWPAFVGVFLIAGLLGWQAFWVFDLEAPNEAAVVLSQEMEEPTVAVEKESQQTASTNSAEAESPQEPVSTVSSQPIGTEISIEQPQKSIASQPLIPNSNGVELVYPGFGGGAGTSASSNNTEPATSTPTPTVTVSPYGEQLDHSLVDISNDHSFQSFTPTVSGNIRSACYWVSGALGIKLKAYFTTNPVGGETYADQTYTGEAGDKEYCFTFTGVSDGYAVVASTSYNLSLYAATGVTFHGTSSNAYTDGAAYQNGLVGLVQDFYFRLSDALVQTGGHPTIVTATANSRTLTAGMSSILATTTDSMAISLTFTEDVITPPTVTVDTSQTVTDCADTSARTFCVSYVPPNETEISLQYLTVEGGVTASGAMRTTMYPFLKIDTKAPVIEQFGWLNDGDSVASTTGVSFGYRVIDTVFPDVLCGFDGVLSGCGFGPTTVSSSTLSVGNHSFTLQAIDMYGHTTTRTRNFIVE